jgi:ParB family chromosome partitioning protein
VLSPAIVRPKEGGGYEMISGHRRMKACELAGVSEIPCLVRNLSDDEAVILMVDSNIQRETVLPSEKAFAYKMKLDAMKRQAGRPPNNSVPMGQNFGKTSREVLSESSPDSNTQIQRYIRLTELTSEILQMVDENALGFRPAVELSYLRKEEQTALLETMQSEERTPSLAQAIKMKQFSEAGRLGADVIFSIMSEEKPNEKEKLTIPCERLKEYFKEDTTQKQMEETIIEALKLYRQKQKNKETGR